MLGPATLQGTPAMTRDAAAAAVRANPKDPDAWFTLGQALATEGDVEKARDCFERALALEPLHKAAHRELQGLDRAAATPLASWLADENAPSTPFSSGQVGAQPLPRRNRTVALWGGGMLLLIALFVVGFVGGAIVLFATRGNGVETAPSVAATAVTGAVESLPPSPFSCVKQAEQFIGETEELFDEWDDANTLASTTSRIALAGPVGQLQALRRRATDLNPPACAEFVHAELIDYMDETVDTYIAFMSDASDSEMSRRFRDASEKLDRFKEDFERLKAGEIPPR